MPAFVCREDAVAAVAGALERPPALVLVEGEAGVGKTRLVQECLWTGRWSERTVLMVECQPNSEPRPLGAVVDGVRRLRERLGGVQLSPLGGALRPLFPEWIDDLPPPPEPLEEPGARWHRVMRAIGELVDRLGVDLLVVEDAHWADAASLEWLQAACASGGRSVVVTYRSEDVPSGSLLHQVTARRPPRMGKVRIALEPLGVAGVQHLTRAMLRHAEVSWGFAEFLHKRTGGLPLAVEESLRLLRARGDIVREGGEWARRELEEIRVPPNVRDSVLERVRRLDRGTRRILEAAAVLDEPADDRLLATVAGLDPSAASAGVAVGFRVGLLRGDLGRVAFRHQLAAQAVHDAIPPVRYGRMHQRAGGALRAGGLASAGRLSRHFREAGDVEAWANYAEQVADLAVESGDDRTATTTLYELLTSVEHPGPRRGRLARKLGEAAAGGASGLADRAGLVLQALRRAVTDRDVPPGERGAIRIQLSRLLRWYGQTEAAHHEIEAAIPDLAGHPGLACRAMLNLAIALSQDWPVRRHVDWVDRAYARFSRIESAADRLHVAALRVSALLALGEEEGWRAAAELPDDGSSPGEQRDIIRSRADIGRLAIKWGRYQEARAWLDEAEERAQAAGYQQALSLARSGHAYLDWYTCQWEKLSESVSRLAEAGGTETTQVQMEAHEIRGLIKLASGAREAGEEMLALLDVLARDAPLGSQAATTAAALGRLRLAEGSPKQALQVTRPVMAKLARKGLWLWATDVAPVHIDALASTGELRPAQELADQFSAWVADRNAPAPAAASGLCRAIVTHASGDPESAADMLALNAGAWAKLHRRYDELLALERQGRCLLAANQKTQALAILSDAQQRLHGMGARWDADRVARSLRQHGVGVSRSWRGGHNGYGNTLSPREREVVALVAQGMTNRQVGQQLFLSPKTVSYHLGIAMRKLGVTTRTRAVMAAVEAGLIPSTRARTGGQPSN